MLQGWVFCGGMIRAGSTLQYQIASELIERADLGRRTTFIPPADHAAALADPPPFGLSTFKTHQLTDPVAAQCRAGGAVALYIFRDLRDVVSSFQRKEGVRLAGQQLTDQVLELVRTDAAWRSLPHVYVSRYEDVILSLGAEVRRIAEFLGVPCPEAVERQIAGDLSYAEQEKTIGSSSPRTWWRTTRRTYITG